MNWCSSILSHNSSFWTVTDILKTIYSGCWCQNRKWRKTMIWRNLIINPDERVQISFCINDDVVLGWIYKPCPEVVRTLIFFQKVNNESYPKYYYCFLFCNLLLQWPSGIGKVLCWTYLHTQFCKFSSHFLNLIFNHFYAFIGI